MTEPQDSTTLQAEHPNEYAGGAHDALVETPPVPYDEALSRCAARIDAGMADSAAYWLGYARQVQATENARTGADDAHLPTYDDLFDAAAAAQEAADTTGVSHHVRKERSTGQLVVQPSTPVDGRRFLTVWGPAEPSINAHLAHARYLGADAALTSVIDHYMMSESDARSILDDVDPEVLDRYESPDLSGWEQACDETLGSMLELDEVPMSVIDAWGEGRDAVWSDALQATALRVLGDVVRACEVEAANEAIVASLRSAAGLS